MSILQIIVKQRENFYKNPQNKNKFLVIILEFSEALRLLDESNYTYADFGMIKGLVEETFHEIFLGGCFISIKKPIEKIEQKLEL